MVDQVAVRLEVGEPPVVVVGAAVVGASAGPVVDRVAQRDHEAHVEGVGQALHGAGHGQLADPVVAGVDAHAVVAHGQEGDRVGVVGRGVGAQAQVEGGGRREVARAPSRAGRPRPTARRRRGRGSGTWSTVGGPRPTRGLRRRWPPAPRRPRRRRAPRPRPDRPGPSGPRTSHPCAGPATSRRAPRGRTRPRRPGRPSP